jgi:hypothetical protein
MEKQNYRRIKIDERVEKYLILEKTPEKKLLNIIKDLKDVFPKQKYWSNLKEGKKEKIQEMLEKFNHRGNFYREIGKYWIKQNQMLAEMFTTFINNFEQEISTEEVLKFFETAEKELSLNYVDIAIFVHFYVEQMVGMQLFDETNSKIEENVDKYFGKHK